MKRSASDSPTPSPVSSTSDTPSPQGAIHPSTPTRKKLKSSTPLTSPPSKNTPSTPTTPKTHKTKAQASNGTWTPEKRSKFMDEVIAAGYKALDLDTTAANLDLSKRQLIDQLVPNRGGNLRGKAVKSAKGE